LTSRSVSSRSLRLQPEIGAPQRFVIGHFRNRAGKADAPAFQYKYARRYFEETDILLGDQERQPAALEANTAVRRGRPGLLPAVSGFIGWLAAVAVEPPSRHSQPAA
jgi:hypothetical protein